MTDDRLALEEHHFSVIAEVALVGIYVIQNDLFRYVNPALARMFGYQPEEIIDQLMIFDLIHPSDQEGVAARMRERFAGQMAVAPHTARGITREGDTIYFESLSTPVNFQGKPAIIGTVVNVTACTQAQEEIEKQRRQLQQLSAQLMASREAESKRISQELHDVIGQLLTAVSLNLAEIQQELPPGTPALVWERLGESEALTTQILAQTRKLSLELRPSMLDELGLLPTLRWYIHEFGNRLNIQASITSNVSGPRFPPEFETMLYRVVQEGLTNIARHAHANKVGVSLISDAYQLLLTISDDGIGFNVEELFQSGQLESRLGLLGIEERISLYAGTLHIHSSPTKGTTLKIAFPHIKPPDN
jgi:two-component system sensor histidine kinase UhpB